MSENHFNGIISNDEFYFDIPDPYFEYVDYESHFKEAIRI